MAPTSTSIPREDPSRSLPDGTCPVGVSAPASRRTPVLFELLPLHWSSERAGSCARLQDPSSGFSAPQLSSMQASLGLKTGAGGTSVAAASLLPSQRGFFFVETPSCAESRPLICRALSEIVALGVVAFSVCSWEEASLGFSSSATSAPPLLLFLQIYFFCLVSLFSLSGTLITYRVGQKQVYSCEYLKHGVYSGIIHCFPYKQL